jgi:hypothetical protein
MRSALSRLIAASLPLVLSACATQYVAPSNGPLAKVRFKVEHSNFAVTFSAYSKEVCKPPATAIGIVGSSNFVREDYAAENYQPIGMLDGAGRATTHVVERSFRADQPIFLDVVAVVDWSIAAGTISATTCKQALEFTPQAGEEYEITHNVLGTQCVTSVNRLAKIDNRVVRQPVSGVQAHKC